MSICYIVGAGEFYGDLEPKENDLVIAADGGYDTLMRLNVRCDAVIGDMDSVRRIPSGVEKVLFPVEKDETDSYLAYLEGVKRGYSSFCLYGGVGGREDHTFANYSLLLYGIRRGHRIRLIGKSHDVFAIKNETASIRGRKGLGLSVFAIGGVARGVSVEGAKYTARDIDISPEFPIGVSNEFSSDSVRVSVSDGELLIMMER
ncbi:MAG: thiamine diphosphokinase [Clostridia bacterium]|nr:thiamine diphosphokinase [Clostridia bacterium]